MSENGQTWTCEEDEDFFDPDIDPDTIETLPQVAEALDLTCETIRAYALRKGNWRGTMSRRCINRNKITQDGDYFFKKGTIAANKDTMSRRKKRPDSEEMQRENDELKQQNAALKKLCDHHSLRLEWIENRIKTGGLLPADEEEGEGF